MRAAHNRCLPGSEKLWPHTTQGEQLGQIGFTLAARPGSKARIVRQHLWARRAGKARIVRQHLWARRAGKDKTVSATCIVAREYDVPAGVKAVEWRLLTNRVADDAAAVSELIDWYRAHCEIKMLFNVLKNGCCVEELQLASIERIEHALALYLVIAWRIAYLMRLGRTCPDLDAKLFFDPDEIQAAYLLNKTLAPPAPRLNEVLRMMAKAGGFLARKNDGEPGAKTIWEGLRDIRASAHTIKTLREMELLSSCV